MHALNNRDNPDIDAKIQNPQRYYGINRLTLSMTRYVLLFFFLLWGPSVNGGIASAFATENNGNLDKLGISERNHMSPNGVSYIKNVPQQDIYAIVEQTITHLERSYLYPRKGKLAGSVLKEQLATGKFNQAFTLERLKHELEVVLAKETGDNNFRLLREASSINTSGSSNAMHLMTRRPGTLESKLLDNDVGYIGLKGNFDNFGDVQQLLLAFDNIKNSNAVIIDLTEVREGSLEFSQTMLGLFLHEGTDIGEIKLGEGRPVQPMLVSKRYKGFEWLDAKPVYVLQSPFLIGPWEYLSYALQICDRATIVGQESMGLANTTRDIPLYQNVYLTMTYGIIQFNGRSDSSGAAITWQNEGVVPDHQVDWQESLKYTLKLISNNPTNH